MRRVSLSWLVICCFVAAPVLADSFALKQGDHVTLLGGGLAERMQHDGWLEAHLQSRFPELELSFRNLGFSGDEVDTWFRSDGFGSRDDHLALQQTDVIFAFYGFGESFAGAEGVEGFRERLVTFIEETRGKQYNGESAPRIVLFSPIAVEKLENPDLPEPDARNAELAAYTDAMREVAAAEEVTFVDLFAASQQSYAASVEPLTINGIHLNDEGNRRIAAAIDRALFGADGAAADTERLEAIRAAAVDKNFYWYHRYRTTDGYNVYGGRSHLKYLNDQTNREVLMREMEILDQMAANRDRVVWAAAQGREVTVDDRSLSPQIPVPTNKPGPLEDGSFPFLSGEAAIEQMTVAEGMEVNLFASEEQFPELINPVQMAFDTQGRLWVATWPSYPHWKPGDPMDDRLLILEDTDGDGRADRVKTFAGGLHNPTGFEFYGGGVIVAMVPDLLFLKDTDGDDKADVRERILHGLDSADTHHSANSFTLSPGGALFFQEGVFHRTQIETPYGVLRNPNACVWRFEPRTAKVDRYVPFNFANPHGHVFDRWGEDFVHDGTGAVPFHGSLVSGYIESPDKHPKPPQLYQQKTRPCPATEILSSRHFPDELQGRLLVGNVIGIQGILQYRIDERGASHHGTEVEQLIGSSDPNFRPADIEVGADGAIYLTDWHNPIIGHMQHHIRDPNRDQKHGRVYRITYRGRALSHSPPIAGEPVEALVRLLAVEENRVRYRAKIELSDRPTAEVMAAVDAWVKELDTADADYAHHLTEALWMHQYHHVVDEELLDRVLDLDDHHARMAGTRVLCYWRDEVADVMGRLRRLAADPHARVRLEAVRAASFLMDAAAVEIALISTQYPDDEYLRYTRGETMRALEPLWRGRLEAGETIAFTTDVGRDFLVENVGNERLLGMERTERVYEELLRRDGIEDAVRLEAIEGIATASNRSEIDVLLATLESLDEGEGSRGVVFDLVRILTTRPAEELREMRERLATLAGEAQTALLRQIGFVGLMAADGDVEPAWTMATESLGGLRDLLASVPLVPDPAYRRALYPQIEQLVSGLPAGLAGEGHSSSGAMGRYVRIELSGRRTLTLAEVEVFSGGSNIAPAGKATQKDTSHGGEASRAIDGNTSGSYSSNSQTHSVERTENPWWEVDLGGEQLIESIVVHNRTDGNLGLRLKDFTLKILDADRKVVFESTENPAPRPSAQFDVTGAAPERVIRRAALAVMPYVRGREADACAVFARAIREDLDRTAAVRAMSRVPAEYWPEEQIAALVETVLASVRATPTEERTSADALAMIQFGNALAARLPEDAAARARRILGELGVQVVRIGTLPHRMSYDVERFAVEAGRTVEIVFENPDLMPHNMVIARPGSLEAVGMLAESTAQAADAVSREYVPETEAILLASRLLQPRESQTLSFAVPTEPGVYPFVCTYPGHWRRMYGALYVVDSLEAYQSDPTSYLAANRLEPQDALLEFHRPRTEWKFDELAPALESLHEGRSFANGKEMFRVANCVACHRLAGDGNQFGPELAKLDPPRTPREILQSLVEPSQKIDEKFRTYVFELESGRVVTGMVVEESDDEVRVIENPLVKAEPEAIAMDEIAERVKSPTSIMPLGLLDRLSRKEILDLVAYVVAGGKADHAIYEPSGEHVGH